MYLNDDTGQRNLTDTYTKHSTQQQDKHLSIPHGAFSDRSYTGPGNKFLKIQEDTNHLFQPEWNETRYFSRRKL